MAICRVLAVMLKKVASTSALTDRRYRKDVQVSSNRFTNLMTPDIWQGYVSAHTECDE